MPNRKCVLYIAMSLDGFIAGEGDDLSWLDAFSKTGEDYGYHAFTAQVDTYVVGGRTYDVVLSMLNDFPAAQQYARCFVVGRKDRAPQKGVTFFSGDPVDLLRELRAEKGDKVIYCDGGGGLVKMLMAGHQIDEYIVTVMPVMLGKGTRLFYGGLPEGEALELLGSKSYANGAIQLHYGQVE